MQNNTRILVTGANGALGRLVIDSLLEKTEAANIVAGVRRPETGKELKNREVEVRLADYDRPDTLETALQGIDRVLLISSTGLGQRVAQHIAVIEAAKRAGVRFLAYTSILRADSSVLALAKEHQETENALRAAGLPFALLRNGWYTENDTAGIPAALESGIIFGCARDGRTSSASRADFAEAAAAILTSPTVESGRVYELAGDSSFTKPELAAEISRQSGKSIVYRDLPEDEYHKVLLQAGFPAAVADLLSGADAEVARGLLYDQGGELSGLIGRPTTSLADTVANALASLEQSVTIR